MAYALLEDEALKARMVEQLTCYLKRLERIEIINLDKQPDAVETLLGYFAGANMALDPDDIDFSSMTRVVMYVHRQINTLNEDVFDTSCPENVQMVPWRVLDGTDDTFIFDVIELALDLDAHNNERAQGINHMYVPSLRGADAMHMMNLATIAYHLTNDEQYRTFLFDELIGQIYADQVAFTAGAFKLPTWCKNWYGDHITYGPWWGMLQLLDESPLKTQMQQAFHEEMWAKVTNFAGNADFEIMYAGEIPQSIADPLVPHRGALASLSQMGGNGGVLDDPRRAYATTADEIVASFQRDMRFDVLPSRSERPAKPILTSLDMRTLASISHDCTGAQTECTMEDGQVPGRSLIKRCLSSSGAIPTTFGSATPSAGTWGVYEGWRQYAGTDFTQPYWNARLRPDLRR